VPTEIDLTPLLEMAREDRTVEIFGPICQPMSFYVWNSLRELEQEDPKEEITVIINSGGGIMHDMFAIVDAMQLCKCPIRTVGTGCIASAATCVVAAGTPGRRFLTPNCSVMIHEASFGIESNLSDVKSELKEVERLQKSYLKIICKTTGKTESQIKEFMDGKNYWMSARDAIKKLGIADKILKRGL
jgi:ATP-dependent Clp protease protease subunit